MSALALAAGALLAMPVPGGQLTDTFRAPRDGGARAHDGVDIMAPRGTPVRAATPGRIARIMLSERGGLTIYQWSRRARVVLTYSHLDGVATGLREGQFVRAGQFLGIVGTTGNAPPDAPHLHFEVGVPIKPGQYWGSTAVNPYPFLRPPARRPAPPRPRAP